MKNLINKDTIKEVTDMYQGSNVSFTEYKIPVGFSIRFGNVVIRKTGNSGLLEMDECVNKELFAQWKKDVGILMSRDFKKGNFNGYYEIKNNNKRALLRKIEYKDLVNLKESGFNHIYIGDYWYTIMRLIPVNGSYNDPDVLAESNLNTYDSYISEYDEKDKVNPFFDENSDNSGYALFDEPSQEPEVETEEFNIEIDDTQDEDF